MKYSRSFQSVMANWSVDALVHMGFFDPSFRDRSPYWRRKELYRK